MLGIGSNGSPEQLARKFPPSQFPQAVIPTVRCALKDFDVVYAPLISSYGSCTGEILVRPPLICVKLMHKMLCSTCLLNAQLFKRAEVSVAEEKC